MPGSPMSLLLSGHGLGAGAFAVQYDGAALDAALGRRPGVVALSDDDLRRHRRRQLAMGRGRGQNTARPGTGRFSNSHVAAPQSGLRYACQSSKRSISIRSTASANPCSNWISTPNGPIVIMIDYDIAEDDVLAFLKAMAARRRVRIRDGAGQWALMRDLENPDIWTEPITRPGSSMCVTTSGAPMPMPRSANGSWPFIGASRAARPPDDRAPTILPHYIAAHKTPIDLSG